MGPAEAHAALIRSVKRELPQLFVNARTDTRWQRPGDLADFRPTHRSMPGRRPGDIVTNESHPRPTSQIRASKKR